MATGRYTTEYACTMKAAVFAIKLQSLSQLPQDGMNSIVGFRV